MIYIASFEVGITQRYGNGITQIFAKTAKENAKSNHLLTNKFHFQYHSDVSVEGRNSNLYVLTRS